MGHTVEWADPGRGGGARWSLGVCVRKSLEFV